jgi:hypothetical protein
MSVAGSAHEAEGTLPHVAREALHWGADGSFLPKRRKHEAAATRGNAVHVSKRR